MANGDHACFWGEAFRVNTGRPADPEPNRLLAALPALDYARIAADLQISRLKPRHVVVYAEEPIEDVYFPRDAVLSMLVPMENGHSVEGAVIGNEGLSGLAVVLGDGTAPEDVVVQIPGEAVRLSGKLFREHLQHSPALLHLVQRYALALMSQLARTAGCNSLHTVDARFARWLLMSRDRVGRDRFPLTHEFAAMMLGVRRASVSQAAAALQASGMIAYRHGQVAILDRRALEAVSCEDYRVNRRIVERLYAVVRD
jgi:CRP-like cAMP-binding protein